MKKGGGYFLGAIAVAALIGALAMRCHIIRYIQRPPERPHTVMGPPKMTPELKIPKTTLRAPHAILVLDVSASMRTSDPRHVQAEAVRQFFSVYSALAREVVPKQEPARLSVVFFSTIAQVIDWTGTGQPWLDITPENESRFDAVMDAYLGMAQPDPRSGADTDYLLALEEVERLSAQLPTAPAVIFMTDGLFDPNPVFHDGSAAPAIREQNQFLSAESHPPIFSARAAGLPRPAIPPQLRERLDGEVKTKRSALLDRSFGADSERIRWTVVFLQASDAGADAARSLLTGDGEGFVHCREPGDVAATFVESVAGWLQLQRRKIEGSQSVNIPRQTEAFAIQLETDPGVQAVSLVSKSGTVPLSGRDGVWSGVAKGGGLWTIAGGDVRQGWLFFKPRFGWVIAVPRSVDIGSDQKEIPVEVHLFDLRRGNVASAERELGESPLPEDLEGELSFPQGTTGGLTLRRANGDGAAYRGAIEPGRVMRDVRIRIPLARFAELNIPTSNEEPLEALIQVHVRIVPVFQDAAGHATEIEIEQVPVWGAKIQRVWERITR